MFLQHKCAQHRPFTCFNWHFLNQRRRRPIRRRDGTFNYSPDVYCTKYDETTGLCPDGDEYVCAFSALGLSARRRGDAQMCDFDGGLVCGDGFPAAVRVPSRLSAQSSFRIGVNAEERFTFMSQHCSAHWIPTFLRLSQAGFICCSMHFILCQSFLIASF